MNGFPVFNRIISEGENTYPYLKEETDMRKKILAGVLTAALLVPAGTTGVLTASARCGNGGNGCGRYYVDNDRDGICDNYGSGRCAGRGNGGNGCGRYFVDEDGDGICDNYADGRAPRSGASQEKKSKNQSLKTKVSIKKGRKYRVKVAKSTKGLTYKTSNRKVATVSKKGVVKARKKGKCTVYAYVNKKVRKKVKLTVL